MDGLLLTKKLLRGLEPLLKLSALGFLLAQLVLQLLQLLLSCSASCCERAVRTLLQTQQMIKSDKHQRASAVHVSMPQTHSPFFLSLQIRYLFVERCHLGFGLQFEFGEASLKFFLLIL